MQSSLTLPFVGLVLAATLPAEALSIVPISQTRELATTSTAVAGTSDSDTDAKAAPGFGPFAESSTSFSSATSAASGAVAAAQGDASQDSSIGPAQISARGEAGAGLTVIWAPATALAQASSLFDVTFSLAADSDFSLSGTLDTLAIMTGGAPVPSLVNQLYLREVGGAFLFQSLTSDEAFSVSGLLEASKTYRIYAEATVNGAVAGDDSLTRTATGLSSFEFDLLVTPRSGTPVPDGDAGVGLLGVGALVALVGFTRRRPA